jgi:hypothetical protein
MAKGKENKAPTEFRSSGTILGRFLKTFMLMKGYKLIVKLPP